LYYAAFTLNVSTIDMLLQTPDCRLSGVDNGLSGVDARMHPAASCQSI